VIVINEAAAAAFFGSASPLGGRLTMFGADTEVVGVVRDTKYDSVRQATAPTMFLPFLQTSPPLTLGAMHVVVRTNVARGAMTGTLRGVVADVDRDLPISRMKTQTDQIEETLGTEFAFTRLLLAFAAFALFLACIGLHGLTAYAVARRTSEIGLRMALGAQRSDVLWLIMRQVVVVTVVGLAAGVPLAIAGGKAVASLLYGVKPIDPASLVIATVVMTVVAGVAAFVPARRAAQLDPLTALRVD
jgi:ABC-type antimicrobial peptide transport system permease subunit